MIYTTTRTPEHQKLIDEVRNKAEENGVKFKPTPRNHHYYFDHTFDLSSADANAIAGIVGANNSFSYVGHLGVVSTEYPLNVEKIGLIADQTMMRG
jgi:hypothetical protein